MKVHVWCPSAHNASRSSGGTSVLNQTPHVAEGKSCHRQFDGQIPLQTARITSSAPGADSPSSAASYPDIVSGKQRHPYALLYLTDRIYYCFYGRDHRATVADQSCCVAVAGVSL